MLNIGRMGRGSQRYYLDAVARRPADYYLGHGEAPGRWSGSGLGGLGLTAGEQVEPDALERVLDGDHPATGTRVAAHPARQVPGFDLTFRAPKSVSLLWALSDPATANTVERAHTAAVDATLAYLERHAARSRRGAGGVEQVAVEGLVTAAFTHRTSRAGDPLLHTHLLVANLARTSDDGVWRTVDSRRLFTHAKTAGTLYQAHLRAELTRALGVAWQPVVHGCADLAGVDRGWVEAFSKRRAAIVAHMAARGETSAAAAQVATLDTRQPKQHQADEPDLRARWRTEAAGHGIPDGWWRQVLDRQPDGRERGGGTAGLLVDDETLTGDSSTFAVRDLHRAIAEHAADGATVTRVEDVARVMVHTGRRSGHLIPLDPNAGGLVDVIRRTDGRLVDAAGGDIRFTTRRLLVTEQQAVTQAVARRHQHAAVVDGQLLQRVLRRRPGLSDEQQAMVVRLTRDGDGVALVVGKAGTGKTYALDAARDAWARAGIRVTGVALAARAALELQDAAGIASTTLARLLHQLDNPATIGTPLQPGQVLVVDEAGMIGTRPLARLLHHAAQRDVKVVLVGDPRQLPEIDAGGLFTGLHRQLPAIELTDNHRQTHRWEQATLDQLRHGDVEQAVATYSHEGRLVTADTVEEIRERLVADWWHTYDHLAADRTLMVALRRADVADLNARARTRLQAAGLLTGPTLQVGDLTFQAGDRVVCLRNHRPAGLVNGLTATITAIHADHTLTIDDDGDIPRTIPADYLHAGHLTHGYAVTGHKAQGRTVDHAYVLGSNALYREWGYVAMSRGRESNRLYVHTTDDIEPDAHLPPAVRNPAAATVTRLSRIRAETALSASPGMRMHRATGRLTSPDARLARQLRTQQAEIRGDRDHTARRLARLQTDLDRRGVALTPRARTTRRHLEEEVDDTAGRLARLDRRLIYIDRQLDGLPSPKQLDAALADHRAAEAEVRQTVTRRLRAALAGDPPAYLHTTIGTPPSDPAGRLEWRRAAEAIETYRTRWAITDPHRPLGPTPPTMPAQRADHEHATRAISQFHHAQTRELAPRRALGRAR